MSNKATTKWQAIFYNVALFDFPSFKYIRRIFLHTESSKTGIRIRYEIKDEETLNDVLLESVFKNNEKLISFEVKDIDIRTRNLKNDVNKVFKNIKKTLWNETD